MFECAGQALDACSTSQVRQELQRLPGAPTQTSRFFSLHAKAADLKQKAADMEAKTVPRPNPPQYGPLWQNVHRFLNGLGSQERMTDLLGRLMVSNSWHALHDASIHAHLHLHPHGMHVYVRSICDHELCLTGQTSCTDSLWWCIYNFREQHMDDKDPSHELPASHELPSSLALSWYGCCQLMLAPA